MTKPDQPSLEGVDEIDEKPSMIARVSALAIKIVFPFIAKEDIRYYLNGANIRPLEGGGVMIIATDGHRYVVVRDIDGYCERELIVSVVKDGLKHASSAKHTFDILSNGRAMIADEVAQPLFIQPGLSVIDGSFPRLENVASAIGYTEGISGAFNPSYLNDALEIGVQFGSIRFFTKDADSPLAFVCDGIAGIDCFGGIMKYRDSFNAMPTWFPRRGSPTTLAEV